MKKLYYSISEVAKILDEEQHVLRYWEREFDILRPKKNKAGNRVYVDKDIANLRTVKKLLREHHYTIQGAREVLQTDEGIKLLVEFQKKPIEVPVPVKSPRKATNTTDADQSEYVKLKRSDVLQIMRLLGDLANFISRM